MAGVPFGPGIQTDGAPTVGKRFSLQLADGKFIHIGTVQYTDGVYIITKRSVYLLTRL